MKGIRIVILGLLAAFLTGCLTMPTFEYYERRDISMQVGEDNIARVTDVFFEDAFRAGTANAYGELISHRVEGTQNTSIRYLLTVSTATRDKLTLQYSEYVLQPLNQYGAISKNDNNWLRRSAFDQTLEFNLNESNKVFFKDYEFEVIESLGGYVKYIRTK